MTTACKVYETIVVGAGIEGSSTAYQLAKRGRDVLLIERFKLGHAHGSSHSLTRTTRKAYGAQDYYTEMMQEAYRLTDELQAECGEQLFWNTGVMILGEKGEEFLESTEASLLRHNVPYERFGYNEAKRRFPNVMYPETFEFLVDKSGGVLRADRMLRAYQTGFVKKGGTIKDEEEMLEIQHGEVVTIKTTKGFYKTKSLVLTLGPWACTWLPRIGVHVPLQPIKVLVCYWKEKTPGEFDHRRFTTFFDATTKPTRDVTHAVYGLPSNERPGYVKVCLHGGQKVDPNKPEDVNMDWAVQALSQYITEHFPSLESTPSFVETCFYTNTPEEDFYLDTHPSWRNVTIGAGFSGHGFKLAPVVGCILADLALGKTPNYDITRFRLDRFIKHKL